MLRSEKIKILGSCLAGSVLEWFDFAVYGYLTPVIAARFFPAGDQLASILLTYAVFAIGFLFRPLGAIFFGYIGDRLGRKSALVWSSLFMALPTFAIGLLPTYESWGIAAPLLLILCRIFQGMSIGGEFTGSFIYLVEQGAPGKKGFYSCFADLGCSSGMLLGSLCVALLNYLLTPGDVALFGWRLPFLSGILLSLVALYMRSGLTESVEFSAVNLPQKAPLQDIFTRFPREFIFGTLLLAINSLGFYILVVFIPNHAFALRASALQAGAVSGSSPYLMNVLVLGVLMVATFVSAVLCDVYDSAKLYLGGIISCILLSYPVFYALHHFNLAGQAFMTALLAVAIGFCFGPRPLFLVSIFPPAVRYSAIALALNIANGFLGGLAPLTATWLIAKTGTIESVAVMVFLAATVALVGMLGLLRSRGISESLVIASVSEDSPLPPRFVWRKG